MSIQKAIVAFLAVAALGRGARILAQPAKPPGPAMMVHFDYYPKDKARIRALEHRLEQAIKRAGAGALGETELHADGNDGYLYMFGPDVDRLYRVTAPMLTASRLTRSAEVTEWHGAHAETFAIGHR